MFWFSALDFNLCASLVRGWTDTHVGTGPVRHWTKCLPLTLWRHSDEPYVKTVAVGFWLNWVLVYYQDEEIKRKEIENTKEKLPSK